MIVSRGLAPFLELIEDISAERERAYQTSKLDEIFSPIGNFLLLKWDVRPLHFFLSYFLRPPNRYNKIYILYSNINLDFILFILREQKLFLEPKNPLPYSIYNHLTRVKVDEDIIYYVSLQLPIIVLNNIKFTMKMLTKLGLNPSNFVIS